MYRFLSIFLSFVVSIQALSSPVNFTQAKKIAGEVFAAHPFTVYCGCRFQNKTIDLASCNMKDAQQKKRAHRLEWEHIMAAEHFGHHFQCWRKPLCTARDGTPYKGRRCCQHIDGLYRHVESELYNLWPEVGLVNQARSNYRFAQLAQKGSFFGCALTIDKSARLVEPIDEVKGLIARAHLFIAQRYKIPLSPGQRKLFVAWNKQFAPSAWEYEWAERVALIEGYENPFITKWS